MDISLKGGGEIPVRERSRNQNREVLESPCVHAGEDVKRSILFPQKYKHRRRPQSQSVHLRFQKNAIELAAKLTLRFLGSILAPS